MTAQAVSVVWWIIGTVGVGGLIAFWFLAPTVAQLALRAVVKLFSFLFSYRIGCALIAAVVAALIADQMRHRYDDKQFAARTAAFEAAQTERDRRIADNTRQKVWTEIANATAANEVTDTQVKEFTDALPPAPQPAPAKGNPFLIGDADAVRLCVIAGQTKCGPSGGQRVPEARRPGRGSRDKGLGLPSLIRSGVGASQKGK